MTVSAHNSIVPGHAEGPVTADLPAVEEHSREFGTENRKFAMWLFIASEITFFAVLIAAFVVARIRFPDEHNVLNIPLTSLNTFILLTSSFTVVRAIAAAQRNDQLKMQRSLALTGLLGTVFLLVQVFEYMNLSHEGLTLSSSPFGMAFFTLTGFHGVHVFLAVLWSGKTFWNSLNGKYTADDHFDIEFFGLYWHFVDVVWILIFVLVYLI